jgi:hypothetical protein
VVVQESTPNNKEQKPIEEESSTRCEICSLFMDAKNIVSRISIASVPYIRTYVNLNWRRKTVTTDPSHIQQLFSSEELEDGVFKWQFFNWCGQAF